MKTEQGGGRRYATGLSIKCHNRSTILSDGVLGRHDGEGEGKGEGVGVRGGKLEGKGLGDE